MPASAPGDCAAGSGPRPAPVVLVVDDDQAFCASLVDILEAKGYRAAAAGSCRQAYAEIERTTPDAAVVDVRLPDGTGLDVLAHAREKSPDTGVIILTGHATLDTAVRALNLGAAGYLEKPYAIDRLFLLLERTIDRRGPGRQSPGQALLASSPMPTVAFDVETAELVATNAAADRLFETIRSGTPASLRSLFSDGGIDAFVDHLADLKARGRAQTDVLIDVPSGGSRWYEVNSVRRDDSPGTALAVVFDVTERRQAEGDSRRARQYFEAIVDNMPGALVIIDSRYVIQRANPAFAAFFRASPAALAGRRCHEVIHQRVSPCQFHGEICPIASCLATGVTVRVMHQHRDAGGRTHHVETTVTPLRDDAGTIVSFISMMTDYTEIRTAQQESEAKSCQLEELNRELTGQREQLARQAADLAAANGELVRLSAAKDEFVSTVSHELRTPLTAISESINLVADGSLGPLDENKTRFLNVATRNCSRLAELINDLLDLSKIEAGRMEASPAALDLGRILHESGETFAVSAGEKRVQLLVELPPGELLAFADERHVRRILANLLSNAVKFTRQGSVTLSAEPRNGGVVVTVADTGAGIPEREVGRIFEKFHQAPARDGSRPQGTGLGLAITRQMVELNKGRIWFETREGIGTRFHFSLPVSAPSTGGTSQ